jgi:hypothetical protein
MKNWCIENKWAGLYFTYDPSSLALGVWVGHSLSYTMLNIEFLVFTFSVKLKRYA